MSDQNVTVSKDSLLPCPFCGSPARGPHFHEHDRTPGGYWWVECAGLGECCTVEMSEGKEAAVARWNQRHTPESPAAHVGFVARGKEDGHIYREFVRPEERFELHDSMEWAPVYIRSTIEPSSAMTLAIRFHETYERLAPSFGYETRTETRVFDPESKNGRLMLAVCTEIGISQSQEASQLTDYQCDEIVSALETYKWTGFTRDDIRLIAGTIATYYIATIGMK